jgi:hypothetical protein
MLQRKLDVKVSARRVLIALLFASAATISIGLAARLVMVHAGPEGGVWRLEQLFWPDRGGVVTRWFAAGQLLAAALLTAAIAMEAAGRGERFVRRWRILALLLAALAFDKTYALHAYVAGPLRAWGEHVHLPYAHVIGALVIAGLAALFFLPLLRSLARPTGELMTVCAVVLLGAELGLGSGQQMLLNATSDEFVIYNLLAAARHLLAMAAVSCLIYVLLGQLKTRIARPQDSGEQ